MLDLDTTTDEVTVGLSLILQSLYYAGYRVASAGKIVTPKGSIVSEENSDELKFVCGNLLNLAIKPLDLSPPRCEGNLKNDCDTGCSRYVRKTCHSVLQVRCSLRVEKRRKIFFAAKRISYA